MKNVLKPSEAILLDEEVIIGSRDTLTESSSSDTIEQGTNHYHAERNYQKAELQESIVNNERLADSDASELGDLAGEVDLSRQSDIAADSHESSSDKQLHSEHDSNSDNFLEFVRDDEQVGEKYSSAQVATSLQDDNPDVAVSSDVDNMSSMHTDASDNQNDFDSDDSEQTPSVSTDQHRDDDVQASDFPNSSPNNNTNQSSNNNVTSEMKNQHPVQSLQTTPSLSQDTLYSLVHKIEDIHTMIASLRDITATRSNGDTQWLTKLSSIEKMLETSDIQKKNGYDEGYKAGYHEAMEKGTDEIKNVIHKIRKITGVLLSRKKEIINESQDTIIELILLIAKKVVKQISQDNKHIVVSNIKDALSKVEKHSNIIVRINPTDFTANEKLLKTISDEMMRDSEIEFVEDTTIDNGGVYVETEHSVVNAQISAQLLAIENSIRDMR